MKEPMIVIRGVDVRGEDRVEKFFRVTNPILLAAALVMLTFNSYLARQDIIALERETAKQAHHIRLLQRQVEILVERNLNQSVPPIQEGKSKKIVWR